MKVVKCVLRGREGVDECIGWKEGGVNKKGEERLSVLVAKGMGGAYDFNKVELVEEKRGI